MELAEATEGLGDAVAKRCAREAGEDLADSRAVDGAGDGELSALHAYQIAGSRLERAELVHERGDSDGLAREVEHVGPIRAAVRAAMNASAQSPA
jgi:hypothetical protein